MEILSTDQDFKTTPEKALSEIDKNWERYDGLIIFGSHAPQMVEEKIERIKWARENNIPFLGICLGLQLMVIEYARNVWGWENATSQEFAPLNKMLDQRSVVVRMADDRVGLYPVRWLDGRGTLEDHWHRYMVNPKLIEGLKIDFEVAWTDEIVEVLKLKGHPFFVGTQFHPEYTSSQERPHFLLKQFIEACKKK